MSISSPCWSRKSIQLINVLENGNKKRWCFCMAALPVTSKCILNVSRNISLSPWMDIPRERRREERRRRKEGRTICGCSRGLIWRSRGHGTAWSWSLVSVGAQKLLLQCFSCSTSSTAFREQKGGEAKPKFSLQTQHILWDGRCTYTIGNYNYLEFDWANRE